MTQDTSKEACERVARAIYEKRNGFGCRAWSRLPDLHKAPYRQDAEAAILALADQPAASGWRDIATVSEEVIQSGTPILIWSPRTHTYVTRGRYWTQENVWREDDGTLLWPFAWQPLPAAPEAPANAE